MFIGEDTLHSSTNILQIVLSRKISLNYLIYHYSRLYCFTYRVHKQWSCIIVLRPKMKVKVAQLCLNLWPHGLYSPWNSLGQNTGVRSFSLLQGIFPAQGSNPGLLHCRWIIYQLSHKGNPRILQWVAYPFSRGSSRPRNRTGVSCIAGGFFTNSSKGKPLLRPKWCINKLFSKTYGI